MHLCTLVHVSKPGSVQSFDGQAEQCNGQCSVSQHAHQGIFHLQRHQRTPTRSQPGQMSIEWHGTMGKHLSISSTAAQAPGMRCCRVCTLGRDPELWKPNAFPDSVRHIRDNATPAHIMRPRCQAIFYRWLVALDGANGPVTLELWKVAVYNTVIFVDELQAGLFWGSPEDGD